MIFQLKDDVDQISLSGMLYNRQNSYSSTFQINEDPFKTVVASKQSRIFKELEEV